MKRHLLLTLLSIMAFKILAQAPKQITVQQAVAAAVNNSPNLKKLTTNASKNVHELASYDAAKKLQLTLEGQLGFNPYLPVQRIPDFINGNLDQTLAVRFGTLQNHQATLNASYLLYSKALDAGRTVLKKSFDLNDVSIDKAKEDLTFSVAKLYFQSQALQYQVKNIDVSVGQLEKLLALGKARKEAGLGLGIDNDRLQLNINNLNAQKNILKSQEQSIIEVMNVVIGEKPGTRLELTSKDLASEEFSPFLDATALKTATLTLLDKQKDLVKSQIDATLASDGASLAAYGNLGGQMQGNGPGDLFKSSQYSAFTSLGVRFSMPIINGSKNKHKAESLKFDLLQIDEDKRAYTQGMEQQYINAYQSYQTNLTQLKINEDNLALARKIFKLTEDRYAAAQAPLIDVLDAQKSLSEAENNLDVAKHSILMSKIDLLYIEGKLKELK